MTPRDQMSQDKSYFFDPKTSGAGKKDNLVRDCKLQNIIKWALTNIVRCVARRF